jgi:hypothetical protein
VYSFGSTLEALVRFGIPDVHVGLPSPTTRTSPEHFPLGCTTGGVTVPILSLPLFKKRGGGTFSSVATVT